MKQAAQATKTFSLLLAGSILLTGCASTTTIQSYPTGAKLYLDGEAVGTTPYKLRDSKVSGSTTHVKLEKEGYSPVYTCISKDEKADVGAIIGGAFTGIPFLWMMKYKPTHTYELIPYTADQAPNTQAQQELEKAELKAGKLRELKKLLDEEVITQGI